MTETAPNYLDPKVLNKITKLELRARLVVEGFVSGMHRSPYHGFSVEFAQHREYVPGDDPRYIDWKIYAKSDRYYIKEFEEETNLRAHLFLDQSESMDYAHDGGMTKFDYAATAVAALSYLIQQQSDAVGLSLFNEEVVRSIPPSNTRASAWASASSPVRFLRVRLSQQSAEASMRSTERSFESVAGGRLCATRPSMTKTSGRIVPTIWTP